VEEDFKLEVEIVTVPNLHMVASSAWQMKVKFYKIESDYNVNKQNCYFVHNI
jgi:hypothetical protein